MTSNAQTLNPPGSAWPAPPELESGIAAAAPDFGELSPAQCEVVLQRNNIGRLAFSLHDRVNVLPVHYKYADGWLYGRTAPGGKLLQILRNRWIAFEVDEPAGLFDWRSVIVHGALYVIDPLRDTSEREAFDHALNLLRDVVPATLAPGDPVPFRNQLFRIHAAEITGRFSVSNAGNKPMPAGNKRTADGADAAADIVLRDEVVAVTAPFVHSNGAAMQIQAYDGVVILSGIVDDARDRVAIEAAVVGLPGVHALVQELETQSPAEMEEGPAELAKRALRELRARPLPDDVRMTVVMDHGWFRAEGFVPSREAHEEILRRLAHVRGARGIIDRLAVLPVAAREAQSLESGALSAARL